jgi:hypothetical protein
MLSGGTGNNGLMYAVILAVIFAAFYFWKGSSFSSSTPSSPFFHVKNKLKTVQNPAISCHFL